MSKSVAVVVLALISGIALVVVNNDRAIEKTSIFQDAGRPQNISTVATEHSPGQATSLSTLPNDQRSLTDTEEVFGAIVRKDHGCTVRQHYIQTGSGQAVEAISCEPKETSDTDPYQDYDSGALASLAYSDPKAAEVLGKRLIESDPQKALELIIRASALSGGDPEPILWLSQANYSVIAVNGEPRVSSIKQAYVLNELAERLGEDHADSDSWRSHLVRAGVSDADIAALDSDVDVLLQTMRNIEMRVTGDSRIGEAS